MVVCSGLLRKVRYTSSGWVEGTFPLPFFYYKIMRIWWLGLPTLSGVKKRFESVLGELGFESPAIRKIINIGIGGNENGNNKRRKI